jgi:hypothetical protein
VAASLSDGGGTSHRDEQDRVEAEGVGDRVAFVHALRRAKQYAAGVHRRPPDEPDARGRRLLLVEAELPARPGEEVEERVLGCPADELVELFAGEDPVPHEDVDRGGGVAVGATRGLAGGLGGDEPAVHERRDSGSVTWIPASLR